jgi:hypothetical protein
LTQFASNNTHTKDAKRIHRKHSKKEVEKQLLIICDPSSHQDDDCMLCGFSALLTMERFATPESSDQITRGKQKQVVQNFEIGFKQLILREEQIRPYSH